MQCPLCDSEKHQHFHSDARRSYRRCDRCQLVFVPPAYFLSLEQERAEYLLHENDPTDPGYRRFLSRLTEPLLSLLSAHASGLDFGCGPGPALAEMLRERGHSVALYDPFFFSDPAPLGASYDFITATEVAEHLHSPGPVLSGLWQKLRPGGLLAVMTKLVVDAEAFSGWHYKNDPTHVCFFSRDTWGWWAKTYGASLHFYGADVIVLQRAR